MTSLAWPRFLKTLAPRKDRVENERPILQVVKSLTWVQWGHFASGCIAWNADAIDFFSVSLGVTRLSAQFNRDISAITTTITVTLILRAFGAAIFGILGDRFGRKWPLVFNLLLITLLELGSSFAETFHQFLILRAFFGLAMGGIWGNVSSNTLENLPVEVRGLASGLLQEMYLAGNLVTALINLYLVPEVPSSWRSLFWTAAGISLFAAILRALLPESEVFLRARASQAVARRSTWQRTVTFWKATKGMLKRNWLLCIYSVCMTSGITFLSHGSLDLYPTFLQVSKALSSHDASIATIIGSSGGVAGCIVAGFTSQIIGRRLTMLIFIVVGGAFIPMWILPTTFSVLTGGFFWMQFFVQGATGVFPIQLAEMSPPAFRATFSGIVYQMGIMISAASAQIEATGGEHLKKILPGQTLPVPDYATIQGILVGAMAAFSAVMIVIGPENLGAHFERHKVAFEEGEGSLEERASNLDSYRDVEKDSASSQDDETQRT